MGRVQLTLASLMLTITVLFCSCATKEITVVRTGFHTSHKNEIDTAFKSTGLFYSLPRTAIVIDIKVKKTTKTPGPYAGYADRFLGLDNIITSAYDEYEMYQVSINGFAEPDPDQVYLVSFPDRDEQNLYVSLNEAGLISSFNSIPNKDQALIDKEGIKHHDLYFQPNTFNYYLDSEIIKEQVAEQTRDENIAVQRQTLRRTWVEKSTELRAREVADYILEIREKKFDLISGFQEIPYSKEALEYMYDEMNKLENDYLDLFTGVTNHKIINYRYIVRPSKTDIKEGSLLFRFSTTEGIIPLTSEGGINVELKYAPINTTYLLEQNISKITSKGQKDSRGFHFRIPEYSDIYLYLGNNRRAQTRMHINQFGVISHLPARDMRIDFHPQTGSIKSIDIRDQ